MGSRRTAASTLLDTYVGHDAGERILAGHIRRGDIKEIHTAIWLSDMRGSPSKLFLERIARLRGTAPSAEWNGVWSLVEK